MEPLCRPPGQPAGNLSEGTAARTAGATVVHRARRGHVLVPSLDGGGGVGLQPVDRFLGGTGHHGIQGVVPRGVGAIVGPGAWPMVRSPDGQGDPWLQVYANHPAVGNVMGWPGEVLPVLQQPLCSLPILAVAVVLDVGTLWLYDRQLRRAIAAVTERRSMAVLVGSKQLARVQGDDAQGHVTEAMFSLPEGDDHVAADDCHILDTLGLAVVIEARAGGQRLVLASARSPGQDGVDVIGEVLRDYGWELLVHGTHSPEVARWPRLIAGLPVMPDGRPILRPVSTWEEARRSLLRCATARTLAGALLRLHDACCDVWQDPWSQCCDGSCVPSRSVLPQ